MGFLDDSAVDSFHMESIFNGSYGDTYTLLCLVRYPDLVAVKFNLMPLSSLCAIAKNVVVCRLSLDNETYISQPQLMPQS